MSQKDKLTEKLLSKTRDFTFDDLITLLNYYGYTLNNKGRTSGSRVMFTNKELPTVIILHKPHERKELLDYQMKQVIDILRKEGLL